MKLVSAIIKPHKLGEVRDAASAMGIVGVTMSEVRGFGRQKGHTELYRGTEYQQDFLPKVRLDFAVENQRVSALVELLTDAASSNRVGDGKVFVSALNDTVRIRTGETGSNAL